MYMYIGMKQLLICLCAMFTLVNKMVHAYNWNHACIENLDRK
jgi:hypothetical protein